MSAVEQVTDAICSILEYTLDRGEADFDSVVKYAISFDVVFEGRVVHFVGVDVGKAPDEDDEDDASDGLVIQATSAHRLLNG